MWAFELSLVLHVPCGSGGPGSESTAFVLSVAFCTCMPCEVSPIRTVHSEPGRASPFNVGPNYMKFRSATHDPLKFNTIWDDR